MCLGLPHEPEAVGGALQVSWLLVCADCGCWSGSQAACALSAALLKGDQGLERHQSGDVSASPLPTVLPRVLQLSESISLLRMW